MDIRQILGLISGVCESEALAAYENGVLQIHQVGDDVNGLKWASLQFDIEPDMNNTEHEMGIVLTQMCALYFINSDQYLILDNTLEVD